MSTLTLGYVFPARGNMDFPEFVVTTANPKLHIGRQAAADPGFVSIITPPDNVSPFNTISRHHCTISYSQHEFVLVCTNASNGVVGWSQPDDDQSPPATTWRLSNGERRVLVGNEYFSLSAKVDTTLAYEDVVVGFETVSVREARHRFAITGPPDPQPSVLKAAIAKPRTRPPAPKAPTAPTLVQAPPMAPNPTTCAADVHAPKIAKGYWCGNDAFCVFCTKCGKILGGPVVGTPLSSPPEPVKNTEPDTGYCPPHQYQAFKDSYCVGLRCPRCNKAFSTGMGISKTGGW